jgi:hypothetical protein
MRRFLGVPAELVRAASRVLLVTLSVTSVGPVFHEVHDEDFRADVVQHDESEHHLQAADPDGAPLDGEHCVACHFVRSSRGPASWEPAGLDPLAAAARLFHTDATFAASTSAGPTPARAPPLA